MTITTYTDKEIALQKRVAELERELSDTDIALEECKMDWSGDVTQIKAEHKVERDTLRQQLAEALARINSLEEIEKQLSDNVIWQAGEIAKHLDAIEASRNQEPAGVLRSDEFDGHVFEPTSGWPFGKLYSAPVVADDVLRMKNALSNAEDALSNWKTWAEARSMEGFGKTCHEANSIALEMVRAAMGGANVS